MTKVTIHSVGWYRIFFSELTGSISVEDWTRWHSVLSKANLHNVLCFSKYWSPLLQGFLYASLVTWHSVYPRNPETAASMLICLYILRNFFYGLTSVISLHKLSFKSLSHPRIAGRLANMPTALPFYSLLQWLNSPTPLGPPQYSWPPRGVLKLFIATILRLTDTEDHTHWDRGRAKLL